MVGRKDDNNCCLAQAMLARSTTTPTPYQSGMNSSIQPSSIRGIRMGAIQKKRNKASQGGAITWLQVDRTERGYFLAFRPRHMPSQLSALASSQSIMVLPRKTSMVMVAPSESMLPGCEDTTKKKTTSVTMLTKLITRR